MKETYKMKGHGPWITVGGKQWCFSCGHVALNNAASDWVTERGCLYDLHPEYKAAMKRLAGDKTVKKAIK